MGAGPPGIGSLADPVGPAVRRAQVHNDLADEAETQKLNTQFE